MYFLKSRGGLNVNLKSCEAVQVVWPEEPSGQVQVQFLLSSMREVVFHYEAAVFINEIQINLKSLLEQSNFKRLSEQLFINFDCCDSYEILSQSDGEEVVICFLMNSRRELEHPLDAEMSPYDVVTFVDTVVSGLPCNHLPFEAVKTAL